MVFKVSREQMSNKKTIFHSQKIQGMQEIITVKSSPKHRLFLQMIMAHELPFALIKVVLTILLLPEIQIVVRNILTNALIVGNT